MRLSGAIAALVVLSAPAATVAQSTDTTDTITITSYATTVTMTLLQVNATTTMHYSSYEPTSFTTSSYNTPALSSTSTISKPSASITQCYNCMGNGASVAHANFAVAVIAGAAALFWSSL